MNVGTVAVDSTELAANASMGLNRTHAGLEAEAERIFRGRPRAKLAQLRCACWCRAPWALACRAVALVAWGGDWG